MTASQEDRAAANARRRFLAACSRFAVAKPPAMELILDCGKRDYATFLSLAAPAADQAQSSFNCSTASSSRE